MSGRRVRLVVIMTHPVQYLSPWFRHIHSHAETLELKVIYATEPTRAQQGVGFGQAFEWDVPLREGYESVVVRPAAAGVSLDSDRFWGLDVPEVLDAVRRLAPDVAMVSGWHSVTQLRAIRALRRGGVPVLYRGDTHLGSSSRRWPRLSRARARLMLRKYAAYLAVGTRSREYLRAMGAADPAIVWSPHAVDNEAFRLRAAEARARRHLLRQAYGFAAGQRVVLYVGKLTAMKRPLDVIDAAARLDHGAVLCVGDGPERTRFEAHARERGVRVACTGFLNQRQVAEAYVAADALMIPGRETWGLVANEALACGLPVVLSADVGSSPDLVADNVCAVVTPGDFVGFARALTAVIEARRRGQTSAADCEQAVERLSFTAATDGLATAVGFVRRNSRPPARHAPARIAALAGNLVFAGGMERITLEALAGLRRGGADVHALLNGWSSRPIAALAEDADLSWEVGFYDAPLDGVFRRPARLCGALWSSALASTHLCRLMIGRRLTHVFAVDFRAVLLHAPALAIARVIGIPVLLRSGVAPTPSPLHARLWRWLIRPLVTRHIANSAYTAGELQAVGIDARRVMTIPNIAPRRHAAPPPSAPRRRCVAYVGQVIAEKGVLQLLDAVGMVVARGYDVELDVAGQMEGWAPEAVHAYRAAVRARAAQPDLAARVRFLGWCEDIDSVLRTASLHCCPSQPEQREGFGITVVEAKRAGLPSVVCPSGALPELIDQRRDGWVTSGFDATAIAEGLEWFLSDEARLIAAQQAAHKSAARFDPAVFERRWHEAFGFRPHVPDDGSGDLVVASARSERSA